jgi:hypothetical protein
LLGSLDCDVTAPNPLDTGGDPKGVTPAPDPPNAVAPVLGTAGCPNGEDEGIFDVDPNAGWTFGAFVAAPHEGELGGIAADGLRDGEPVIKGDCVGAVESSLFAENGEADGTVEVCPKAVCVVEPPPNDE